MSFTPEYNEKKYQSFTALYWAVVEDASESWRRCTMGPTASYEVMEVLRSAPQDMFAYEAGRLMVLHQIDPAGEAAMWAAANKKERRDSFDEPSWKFRAWAREAAYAAFSQRGFGKSVAIMLDSQIVTGPEPAPFNPSSENFVESLRRIDEDNKLGCEPPAPDHHNIEMAKKLKKQIWDSFGPKGTPGQKVGSTADLDYQIMRAEGRNMFGKNSEWLAFFAAATLPECMEAAKKKATFSATEYGRFVSM